MPAEAIIFNRDGLQVAVAHDGKAEIRKLAVTRDFGTWVEADAGVRSGEQVILNPPVDLVRRRQSTDTLQHHDAVQMNWGSELTGARGVAA